MRKEDGTEGVLGSSFLHEEIEKKIFAFKEGVNERELRPTKAFVTTDIRTQYLNTITRPQLPNISPLVKA